MLKFKANQISLGQLIRLAEPGNFPLSILQFAQVDQIFEPS